MVIQLILPLRNNIIPGNLPPMELLPCFSLLSAQYPLYILARLDLVFRYQRETSIIILISKNKTTSLATQSFKIDGFGLQKSKGPLDELAPLNKLVFFFFFC